LIDMLSCNIFEKKDVRRFYDETADSYDELYGLEQKEKYGLALELGGIGVKGNMLDAGCGTSLFEETLEENVKKDCLFFGVDVSRRLLEKAKQKLAGRLNMFLVCGDIDHLPFHDGSFDICLAFTVLQNLPNTVSALKELTRVSKIDSTILFTYLKTKTDPEKIRLILDQAELEGKIFDNPKLNEFIVIGKPKLAMKSQ